MLGLEDDDTLLLKEDRTLKDSGIGEQGHWWVENHWASWPVVQGSWLIVSRKFSAK